MCSSRDMLADRQTDIQTDTVITILCSAIGGKVTRLQRDHVTCYVSQISVNCCTTVTDWHFLPAGHTAANLYLWAQFPRAEPQNRANTWLRQLFQVHYVIISWLHLSFLMHFNVWRLKVQRWDTDREMLEQKVLHGTCCYHVWRQCR